MSDKKPPQPAHARTVVRLQDVRPSAHHKLHSPSIPSLKVPKRPTAIQHFSATKATKARPRESPRDMGVVPHPLQRAARKKLAIKTKPLSAQQRKQQAISQALASAQPAKPVPSFWQKHFRFIGLTASTVFVLIVVAWFVWANLPDLSVRIASAQVGIRGSYPSYHPDGYSLQQPIKTTDDGIVLRFQSRANSGSYFTISQVKSSWDSSAVEQSVSDATRGKYTTSQSSGLTIFSDQTGAWWVNGGILYTVKGTAQLSTDQLVRLAVSLT